MIYLDHNATTPVRPAVAEAISRAIRDTPGNPSSVHGWGRAARDAVERARAQVAELLGVRPEEIVFTSGGTEGDNLTIRGLCAGATVGGRTHLVTSPLEHPAVAGAVESLLRAEPGRWSVTRLPVNDLGQLDPAALEDALRRDDTALVSLALANHELGNIYPVARYAELARSRGALMHTDAVQAAGKLPLDLTALGVDSATVSAHKLGGPKGVGAVFVRRGVDLQPLVEGGHQERERRPGTENVAGIVGFGVACDLVRAEVQDSLRSREGMGLRQDLLRVLAAVPGSRIFGASESLLDGGLDGGLEARLEAQLDDRRLSNTVMVAFAGAPGQLVAIGLDLEGICVSTGAACTSGSLQPSAVLRALGLDPARAAEGVRFSLGWTTTAADIAALGRVLPGIVARVRTATSARLPTGGQGPAEIAVPVTAATPARESQVS